MAQYYKRPGFTLSGAALSTRFLLTLFMLSVLAGLAVALLQYADRAGLDARSATEWVAGNEDDPAAREIKPRKSYRELLALTHQHALALPMLLFVLLHLVELCAIRAALKVILYAAGFFSLAGSLAGPWLIAWGGPGWSAPMVASGSVLTAVMALAALLCLHEMWLARPLRGWRHRPEPPPADPLFPVRRAREEKGVDARGPSGNPDGPEISRRRLDS